VPQRTKIRNSIPFGGNLGDARWLMAVRMMEEEEEEIKRKRTER
jgi:hypothetical protein